MASIPNIKYYFKVKYILCMELKYPNYHKWHISQAYELSHLRRKCRRRKKMIWEWKTEREKRIRKIKRIHEKTLGRGGKVSLPLTCSIIEWYPVGYTFHTVYRMCLILCKCSVGLPIGIHFYYHAEKKKKPLTPKRKSEAQRNYSLQWCFANIFLNFWIFKILFTLLR